MFQLHAAGEKLDWHQDWSNWIEAGDTITGSEWAITPEGPTLSGDITEGFITSVFVDGLEAGMSYQLLNTVTTEGGRIGQREITLRCQTP